MFDFYSFSEAKVAGCVGQVSSLDKKGASLCEREIGLGNTVAWRLGGVDPTSTAAFFFDISNLVFIFDLDFS
jgi:protein transport protein SEC23